MDIFENACFNIAWITQVLAIIGLFISILIANLSLGIISMMFGTFSAGLLIVTYTLYCRDQGEQNADWMYGFYIYSRRETQ